MRHPPSSLATRLSRHFPLLAHHPQTTRPWVYVALLIGGLVLLALLYARTLAPGVTWAHAGGDSGDLATAVAVGGVPHPSGYPTYLLLARLTTSLLPVEPAWSLGVLSAALALGTVALVARLASHLTAAPLLAILAALWLGVSPLLWSQAVIAEVYTLHALFVTLLLLRIWRRLDNAPPTPRADIAEGVVAGLALGNHLTALLVVAAWLLVGRQAGVLWRKAGGLAAGLLVYAALPLAALTDPPINWGNPATWHGFWWLVSGQAYQPLAFAVPPDFWLARVRAWADLLIEQFGAVGGALALLGLFYHPAQARHFVRLSVLLAAGYSLLAIGYDTADSYVYLLPVSIMLALWLALGAAQVAAWLARWPLARALLTLGMLAALIGTGWQAFPNVDASDDRRAIAYAEAVLHHAPPEALLIAHNDHEAFPLWYAHYAQMQRPDVVVVVEPLLVFAWYRDTLRQTYASLTIREAAPPTAAALHAANPARPLCRVSTTAPWIDCRARIENH
jgi:hypothetical protein